MRVLALLYGRIPRFFRNAGRQGGPESGSERRNEILLLLSDRPRTAHFLELRNSLSSRISFGI